MIFTDVPAFEIIKQFSPSRDQLKQSAPRIVVLLVYLEMLSQLIDALGQKSNLNLRRTGVRRMGFVITYDLFFNFFYCRHCLALAASPLVCSNSGLRLKRPVTAKFSILFYNAIVLIKLTRAGINGNPSVLELLHKFCGKLSLLKFLVRHYFTVKRDRCLDAFYDHHLQGPLHSRDGEVTRPGVHNEFSDH